MKMDHNLVAAMLIGMAAGEIRFPPRATDCNRFHMERAPRGSAAEAARIAEGDAKRAAKLARRAARAPK